LNIAHIKHLLITGASGFVGRSVIDFLSTLAFDQRPEKVTLVSRTEIREVIGEIDRILRIEQVPADLLYAWKFDSSVTHILQLVADGSASAYTHKASDDFVTFSQRLIEWCETLPQRPVVVHVSSGACFGYFPLSVKSGSNVGATSASSRIWPKARFVESRLTAERLLQQAHDATKIDLRIARLYSFIGEHLREKTHYAVPSFVSMAKISREIRVSGDPMTVRSYLSAHDMANWIVGALQADTDLPLLSIGSCVPVTMLELAEFIAERLSAKVVLSAQYPEGDCYVADNKLTKDLLKVDQTISWQESLLDFIES